MKEVLSLKGAFDAWDASRRDWLVEELIGGLGTYRDDRRVRRFTCSVDLAAHDKWQRRRNHPTPERLCARVLFPHAIEWAYERSDKGVSVDFFEAWFDQGESFIGHVKEDWADRGYRTERPIWNLVRAIDTAEMKATIPLQVADLVAWSRNRIEANTGNEIDKALAWAYRITNGSLSGIHWEIGEKAMRESTFSEEGSRRERLFKEARRRHR